MSAIDENETLEACIARVQEEEGVDEAAARQICEDLRGEGNNDDAEESEEASGGFAIHNVATETIRPINSASAGTTDSDSVDAEISSLVIKKAQRQPGETVEECVTRLQDEEGLSEDEARETCSGEAEEASVKQAQREVGESMDDCVTRIMEEEDVDEETAREACEEVAEE